MSPNMKTKSKKKVTKVKPIDRTDFRGRLLKLNAGNLPKPEKGSREEGIDALIQDMLNALWMADHMTQHVKNELDNIKKIPAVAVALATQDQIQILEARLDALERAGNLKDYNDSYH